MNKLESRYAATLEQSKSNGGVLWFAYEAIKLRLADKTTLTPDFFVLTADGELQCHEVKGFMRDDANVKLKCAAEKFPFRFFLVRWIGETWDIKEI